MGLTASWKRPEACYPRFTVYFEPQCTEFAARTMWSLSNAFTSAFKKFDPVPQFKATAKLGSNYRGPISQGKLWITFDDFGIQLRCLALTPHGCSEPDPII